VSEAVAVKGAVRPAQNCLREGKCTWSSWWTMAASL